MYIFDFDSQNGKSRLNAFSYCNLEPRGKSVLFAFKRSVRVRAAGKEEDNLERLVLIYLDYEDTIFDFKDLLYADPAFETLEGKFLEALLPRPFNGESWEDFLGVSLMRAIKRLIWKKNLLEERYKQIGHEKARSRKLEIEFEEIGMMLMSAYSYEGFERIEEKLMEAMRPPFNEEYWVDDEEFSVNALGVSLMRAIKLLLWQTDLVNEKFNQIAFQEKSPSLKYAEMEQLFLNLRSNVVEFQGRVRISLLEDKSEDKDLCYFVCGGDVVFLKSAIKNFLNSLQFIEETGRQETNN